MPNLSDVLSVAIGLTFIFLILSLLNTWVQEFIASILSLRSKNLADILQNMLDPGAQKLEGAKKLGELKAECANMPFDAAGKLNKSAFLAIYDHQLIKSLSKPGALPSYIHAKDFAAALLDLLSKAGSKNPTRLKITLRNVQKGINELTNLSMKMRLQSLMNSTMILENEAEVGIADFRKSVESWFDSAMERGCGWYKRRIQCIGIVTGILIALVANADTIGMASALWQNSALRVAVTETAVIYTQQGQDLKAQEAQKQLVDLGFPFGWSGNPVDQNPETPDNPRDFPSTPFGWIVKGIGILITGFAISQGSPIWFDLLNRMINLRGTGTPVASAAKKAGKDEEDKK